MTEVQTEEEQRIFDEKISQLQDLVNNLKSNISEFRKKGFDLVMADLALKNISAKFKWAEVNRKKEDLEIINLIIKEVEKELAEETKKKILNVKEEVLSIAGLNDKEEDESINLKKLSYEDKEESASVSDDERLEKDYKVLKPSEYFFLKSGGFLKSLNDLITKLPLMNDEDFKFHTRNFDNDFAKWTERVFKDAELAKKIKGVTDKQELLTILKEGIRGE